MKSNQESLVEVESVQKEFGGTGYLRLFGSTKVRAVNDVSFRIGSGETLGLVGESGSGKSTVARMSVGLLPVTSGKMTIDGLDVSLLRGGQRKELWKRAQMVFQDPHSSLNPKLSVRDALAEPLKNYGIAVGPNADVIVRRTLDACGLPASAMARFPREFSGGQRQRIGIARAIIIKPRFIVADEPVSALDVSIQAQIINLLQDLKEELGLTYLFIAHDLAVVRHISDRVAVMYRGTLVEVGLTDDIYDHPIHPYTKLLLQSVPVPDLALERERRLALSRSPRRDAPDSGAGCPFAARCPIAEFPICSQVVPPLRSRGGRSVACHFSGMSAAIDAKDFGQLGERLSLSSVQSDQPTT